MLPPDKAPPRADDWDWDGDGWDPAASLTARELAELAALDRAGDSAEDWDDDIGDAAPVNMDEWLTGRWVPDEEPSPRPGGLPTEALPGLMPRRLGTGGGFDAGGVANRLPPGPVLAGPAADKCAAGLGRATDDELAGLMIAWRRIAPWAAAGEFAVVAELCRRRQAQAVADTHLAEHVGEEIAMVLTLTSWAAGTLVDRAEGLARLPKTRAALAAGQIDVSKALVILGELTGLDGVHAARVEAAVIGRAEGWTTGELRRAVRRQVIAADPDAARRHKERAAKQARVERWAEDAGTAALAGRDLPPAGVLAADAHLSAWATRLKAAGLAGNLDQLRAQVYLALLNGQPPETLLPTGANPAYSEAVPAPSPAPDQQPTGANPTNGDAAPAPSPAPGQQPTGANPTNGDAVPAPSPAPGQQPTGANPTYSDAVPAPSPAPDQQPTGANPTYSDAVPAHSPAPGPAVRGSVNLVLPLSTWLGWTATPGEVAGFGPLDAADSRALAPLWPETRPLPGV